MINEILSALLKLQAINAEQAEADPSLVAKLRQGVPPQILAHFDRLQARGKKGVAVVRNGVCSGCHMKLPIGTMVTLMHGADIQICDTCGRYLALEPPAPAPASATPAAKPKTPKRKRAAAHAQ